MLDTNLLKIAVFFVVVWWVFREKRIPRFR